MTTLKNLNAAFLSELAAATTISAVAGLKVSIRQHSALSQTDKTLLLTAAEEREDAIAAHHLGKTTIKKA